MIRFVNRQSGMFLEGDQAELYKWRKNRDKEDKRTDERYRANHRTPDRIGSPDQKRMAKKAMYNSKYNDGREDKDIKSVIDHFNKNDSEEKEERSLGDGYRTRETFTDAISATKRHSRRHPTKESTMFLAVNGVSLF